MQSHSSWHAFAILSPSARLENVLDESISSVSRLPLSFRPRQRTSAAIARHDVKSIHLPPNSMTKVKSLTSAKFSSSSIPVEIPCATSHGSTGESHSYWPSFRRLQAELITNTLFESFCSAASKIILQLVDTRWRLPSIVAEIDRRPPHSSESQSLQRRRWRIIIIANCNYLRIFPPLSR